MGFIKKQKDKFKKIVSPNKTYEFRVFVANVHFGRIETINTSPEVRAKEITTEGFYFENKYFPPHSIFKVLWEEKD